MIFQKLGGIDFLLPCDFDVGKPPVKLSDYHQQALLYWNLLYKHNCTPHNSPLWNSRCVLFRGESLFFDTWLDKGIWAVSHWMNDQGDFSCAKYNLNCSIREYNKVIKAIPAPFKSMTQKLVLHANIFVAVEGISLGSKQCSNKFIRSVLTTKYHLYQLKRDYIVHDFSRVETKRIRKGFLSFPVLHKAKEVTFKIFNDIYPSNNFLHLRFNWENNSCVFCDRHIETMEHIFFECVYVKEFCLSVLNWLCSKQITLDPLTWLDVKVGVNSKENDTDFRVNNIIVLCKCFIHRCKYFKIRPQMIGLKNFLIVFYCKKSS